VFRLNAYVIISAAIFLGGCLSLYLRDREQIRRYTGITKLSFWLAFAIAIFAILWGALTMVTEMGYRVLGVCVLVFAAILYATVFWLGLYYSTDVSRPRTKGRKVIAVLLFLLFPVTLFFLLTGIAAGIGTLPRWSDLLFLLAPLGSCAYLYEFFAHGGKTLSPSFWKGVIVTSIIFIVTIAWVITDTLMSSL